MGCILLSILRHVYTYFTNAIIPDYDTNPNQIIYDNLDGFSQSSGLSLNIDAVFW